MLTRLSPRARGEQGQVVVFFALLLPVLFALGAIVLSIGNWYVHKRHLQTQVDAAALASGPAFVGCFHDAPAANLAIASRALAYAGDTLRPGKFAPNLADTTTNLQLQEPDDVRIALNSATYWTDADGMVPGTDGYGLDNTLDTDGDLLGDPCNEAALEVKATDDDAPLLWKVLPATPSPKSKARIEIFDAEELIGLLPWAVPEIDPRRVVALFVNEDDGTVYDHQLLDKCTPAAIPPATSWPWSGWCTSAGQEQIDVDVENTGVIILVSKNEDVPPTGTLQVSGALGTICSQSPGLVACYSGGAANSGLSFIHAYNGTPSGAITSPQAREVQLFDVGCTAADLSAPYFTLDGGCSANVQAVVDFGVTGDPRDLGDGCATINGFTWSPGGLGGPFGTWSGSVSLPADSGRNEVDLVWAAGNREQGSSGTCHPNQPNSGTMNKVAAPYVGNTASGPVQYLQLQASYEDLTPVTDANSIEKTDPGNTYYNYFVTVGLPKPLSVDNYDEDPVLLRMASPSGSQNQAWDCDAGRNFVEEIETGCRTRYIENFRDHDDNVATPKQWNNILCTGWSTTNLPPPTIDGPAPYPSDCVITETGDKTGQLRDGLHERLETPCTPNNWPDDATEADIFFGPDGGGYGNDPRYVTLIITDNTAFTGSGNEPLPIKYFAGFYVTGWDFHPVQSPGCGDPDGGGPLKGNDDHPLYGTGYTHSLDDGDVWGYFVDIVVFSGGGLPSDEHCEFGSDPAACIAVLVE